MRLLKSCGNGRTVDDGKQKEPWPGWLSIFINKNTAWEANICLFGFRRQSLTVRLFSG